MLLDLIYLFYKNLKLLNIGLYSLDYLQLNQLFEIGKVPLKVLEFDVGNECQLEIHLDLVILEDLRGCH